MARFQENKARDDQRPAADHAGHQGLMENLRNPQDSSDMDTLADARVPKARKPYTITKQREKWTEDEHKLFLEALQLHGRAWRRIQEHIGTKTAVQIRSHAQKFFSKVSQPSHCVQNFPPDMKTFHGLCCLQADVIRESSGDSINSSGAAPPIQIPPPRPKKKPAHPYPRKLGSALRHLEKPQLQIQILHEQEKGSPTSVLTTAQIGSENLDSDSSGSPASTIDVEERCPTPSIETAELAVQVLPTNVKDAKGDITQREAACDKSETPFLRLFGKRVVLSDLHQQTNSNNCNLKNAIEMELDASAETPTSGTGKFSSHSAAAANTWRPWLSNSQQFLYFLPQGDVFSLHSALPCFSYNNGTVLCPPEAVNPNIQHQYLPPQAVDHKFMQWEGSWTESNTASSSIPVLGLRKCVSPVSVRQQGFVPYKRCAAESEVLHSQVPGEEADGEMTKLCL